MKFLTNNQTDTNNQHDACDMKDKLNILSNHIDSISAIVCISNLANIDEGDNWIHSRVLNGIGIINDSSDLLVNQIKEYFHEV